MAVQPDRGAVAPPSGGEPGEPEPERRRRPLRRRWWFWVLLAAGVAVGAAVVLAVAASRYQPIAYGSVGSGIEAFPGLPTGKGIRPVNDLGGFHEDIYVPPQRGTFSLFVDVRNTGTHPVTILAVSLGRLAPFALSAPVRYSEQGMGGSRQVPPPASRVLHSVALHPGQEIFVGFPVHMWPCTSNEGWESDAGFYVTFRYAIFTRTVLVPWGSLGDSLLVRSPGGKPGQKGVTCAAGTTRANLPKVPGGDSGPRSVAGAIVRIDKGDDVGELRLMEETGPDAARDIGGPLPACFLQLPPDLPSRADYRVVNFDLNWADINVGQHGTAPAVRITIAGPDGQPLVAAIPQGGAGNGMSCRPVRSFLLGRQTTGWQLVYGLSLRVPQLAVLDHLLITADGHTIAVPLTPACGTSSAGRECFPADELGGPWIAGTPYSVSMRI